MTEERKRELEHTIGRITDELKCVVEELGHCISIQVTPYTFCGEVFMSTCITSHPEEDICILRDREHITNMLSPKEGEGKLKRSNEQTN